jgi:hypothetical protein
MTLNKKEIQAIFSILTISNARRPELATLQRLRAVILAKLCHALCAQLQRRLPSSGRLAFGARPTGINIIDIQAKEEQQDVERLINPQHVDHIMMIACHSAGETSFLHNR